MCGLVGMLGHIDTKEKKAFKDLLRIDQVRGSHSVGAYSKGVNKEFLFKKAISPDEMFTMKGWEELERSSSNLYIGHNRHATQGAINSVNAHPFEQGIIVGAHNGTLRQQNLLPDSQLFPVDSENIIYSLSEKGVQETVKRLKGAYALTWYNKKDNTFNMVRNSERELFYCYSTDNKTLFWASESWMLYGATLRNGISITKPVKVEVDTHYSIELPLEYTKQAKTLGKLTSREVEPYKEEAPPYNTSSFKGTKERDVNRFPIYFTKSDNVRIGDKIYFWKGDVDKEGKFMSCPVESNHRYDARVYLKGLPHVVEKMLLDDKKADILYEGVVYGQYHGSSYPSVIVNPKTVSAVSEKKQRELLLASTV